MLRENINRNVEIPELEPTIEANNRRMRLPQYVKAMTLENADYRYLIRPGYPCCQSLVSPWVMQIYGPRVPQSFVAIAKPP